MKKYDAEKMMRHLSAQLGSEFDAYFWMMNNVAISDSDTTRYVLEAVLADSISDVFFQQL